MVFGFLLIFQIPILQEKLAVEFSKWVNTEYGLSIASEKIKLGLFSGLVWEEVLFVDSKNDTLIYVEEIKVTTTDFTLNHLNKIYIKGLYVNYTYTDSLLDAEFYQLLKPLFNKSESASYLSLDNIWLSDAELNLSNTEETRHFSNLNVYLKDVVLGESSRFVLSDLNWNQVGGDSHRLRASSVSISSAETSLNGFNWKSGTSEIDLNFFHSYLSDSTTVDLSTFKVNKKACDGLFNAWPNTLELQMNGLLAVEDHKLSTHNFTVSTANGSHVNGDLSIANVYSFKDWNYLLNAPNLSINKNDWPWLEPLFEYNYLISKLGTVGAAVNIEGTIATVDLEIDLSSDIGDLTTNILITKADSTLAPDYVGSIGFTDFDLSPFVKNGGVSVLNANLQVQGNGFNEESFAADLIGDVTSIEIGSYLYENIQLNGRLQPDYFNGIALVKDDNLDLEFSGEVDFSKAKPVMDFTADIIEANLVQLNWFQMESKAQFSSLIEMNLVGDSWSNIEGSLGVYFTTLETEESYYHFNDLLFNSSKSNAGDTLTLSSDFANAQLDGDIDIPNLYNSFLAYLAPHFPLIPNSISKEQDFNFTVDVFNSSVLTDLLLPNLHLGDGAHIYGLFNTRNEGLDLTITSPNLGWGNWLWRDLEINSIATREHWQVDLLSSQLDYKLETKFENIELEQIGTLGDWRYVLAWTSNDSIKFDGILKANAHIDTKSINVDVEESQFYFADTLWDLNQHSSIYYHTKGLTNANVLVSTSDQNIEFNYTKNQSLEELNLFVSDFEFSNINPWLSKSNSSLIGKLTGDVKINNFSEKPLIQANLFSPNLIVNAHPLGDVELKIAYTDLDDSHLINGQVFKGINKTIGISGNYFSQLDSNNFNLDVEVHDFDIKHFQNYVDKTFDDLSGSSVGFINVYGNLNAPLFDGEFLLEDLSLSVPYLDVAFETIDQSTLKLSERHIEFVDLSFASISDEIPVGKGVLSGELLHNYFTDFSLGLDLKADSLLCLDTNAYRDEPYYGKAIATGDVLFRGPFSAIEIDVNAKTNNGTTLFIPLDDKESLDELSFVHFIETETQTDDSLWTLAKVITSKSGLLIDMNFEVSEEAVVNIIFDEALGDKITATGNGFINLGVNASDEVYMFGDYTLSQGDYLFTLQNFVNKRFEIENGAKMVWDGNPYTAQMDLTAVYNVNTNISDLAPEYNRKTDVECSMLMSGDLLQPSIEFDIQIPKGDDLINRILEERTNTEEKKTQQFLSLLVLNSFMSADELQNTDVDYLSTTLSTGTEVLSNQLSNWMSQFTDRFDLGFKYHPNQGDTLSNKEFELLMNNMKVNDRITFNGNIGTQPAQNTTRIIGDFKVEYQIREDGKLKFLAFRNLEESFQLQDDASNYTTGVGLFYRDEFDDFTHMWHKFLGMFKRKKSK